MTVAPTPSYVHEVGFYASDDEFADLIVPFAREGVDNGEPVIFAYDEYKSDLLREWLPQSDAVTFVTDAGPYATPTKALAAWRALIQDHLDAGARRVRIAGNVPHPGYGIPYAGWDRYEAAVDLALGDLPVWAPCLYDARIAPPAVVERAKSLHHRLRQRDGTHQVNAGYQARTRLADFLSHEPDPLERTVPAVELTDPQPAQVRAAVRRLAASRLTADRADQLVLAASEAATNARLHGVPPVVVRGWADERQIIVHVRDSGEGPADPLVGLLPTADLEEGGRGLWIAHQLDVDVALVPAERGFTVKVSAPTG